MKRNVVGIVLLTLAFASFAESKQGSSRSARLVAQKAFFNNLMKMCGQQFEGVTDFPQNADHPMVGKKLMMSVGPCTQDEIRVPFQVGDDKSRTWILTFGVRGLLFKHDHRHPDGTPDQITNYGGWGDEAGTTHKQNFPADPDTTKLIPEAATNVWTLEFVSEKNQFMYYLERNSQPRYRAYFDLKPPVLLQKNAKATVFASVYTNMKRDCRLLPEPKSADSGGDPAGVCKGYGGYRIFISHSAWSAQFSVQSLKNIAESIDLGNDYGSYGARGEKIEWRTANGLPFAVIMRLGKYKERDDGENPYTTANRTGSVLIVKGLKGWEHINFTVEGGAGDNLKARALVDENFSRKQ
ncbi:MAG TPA: hypothetical protein VNO50_11580 [Pyrinomonadaceae bacterium]|nr:hypothetical protein [Pyrinomonadaceae bacterium]